MARRASTVFLVLSAGSSASATVAFSVVALYRFRTAGLDEFQLVLAGTVMEATVFLCELPTGVVADLVSRRLSVIVGQLGMGAAFLVEAAHPSLTNVLAGQVLWGLAYTFTSGATVAWIAGELDHDHEGDGDGGGGDASGGRREALTDLFLRASRLGSAAALLVFAGAGSFAVAGIAALVVHRTRSVRHTLLRAWIVPLTPPGERATVLSALEQADSLSQMTIGPSMGVIAARAGVPVALAASAIALLPALPVLRRAGAAEPPTPARNGGSRRP